MTRINCSDFIAEMSNLLDESVAAELRAHLQAHLAVCETCSVLYDSTRKSLHILTNAGAFELDAPQLKADAERIMARIRAEGSGPA